MVVTLEHGVRPIGQTDVGDHVWTQHGRWRPVLEVLHLGNRPIASLQVANLGVLRGAVDQQLIAARTRKPTGRRREWEDLSWSSVGDGVDLAVASRADFVPTVQVPAASLWARERAKAICATDSVDFLWAAGRYVADGCLAGRRSGDASPRRIVWTIGRGKEGDVERLLRAGLHANVQPHSSGSALTVNVSSMAMARWFEQHCGAGAVDKHVPGWIFGLGWEQRAAFWDGYVSGDGCRQAGFISAATVSVRLAHGLATLAESLGMVSHLSARASSRRVFGENEYQGRPYWCLRAVEADRCHAGHRAPFSLRRGRALLDVVHEPAMSLRVADDGAFSVTGAVVAGVGMTATLPSVQPVR